MKSYAWLCLVRDKMRVAVGYLYLLSALALVNADGDSVFPAREFRGVWVATVSNIDWPSSRHLSSDQQKAELTTILDKLQDLNFNAVIFQIRPAGDALYNSTYEPWSAYLTGTQGRAPSPYYDPLEFAIEEAHKRNIELHAWFNPYRARSGSGSKSGLSSKHMVNRFPEYAYAYGNNVIMDPGATEVSNFVFNVFMDVVRRYDLDGIHIDDYFYPYPVKGITFPDSSTYRAYTDGGGRLSLSDWRRRNVDNLIQRLANGIRNIKSYVKFGISPFGIWKPGHPHGVVGLNAYSEIYGDSRKWFQEGWTDYLAPQLYWRIDPPQQSYTALLDWWVNQNGQNHHLYVGNYAGRVQVSNWPTEEIKRQITESRKRRDGYSLGNIQFSAKYIRDNNHRINEVFEDLYSHPALTPEMPWLNYTEPVAPSHVRYQDGNISWSPDTSGTVRSWVVYRFEMDTWKIVKILNQLTRTIAVSAGHYSITAVNRIGQQSEAMPVVIQPVSVG